MGTEAIGWTLFKWRGKPIMNIYKWAEENNQPMVKVKETKITPYGTTIEHTTMPKCFADNLCVYEGWGGGSVTREIIEDA